MALIKDHLRAGFNGEAIMVRALHALCFLVVLSAANVAFAAPAKKQRTTQSKKSAKKTRKLLIEHSRKKPSEKPAIAAAPPAAEQEKKKLAVEANAERWTDPLALRDTLFLSTAARRARVEAGVIEEEKRDVTK